MHPDATIFGRAEKKNFRQLSCHQIVAGGHLFLFPKNRKNRDDRERKVMARTATMKHFWNLLTTSTFLCIATAWAGRDGHEERQRSLQDGLLRRGMGMKMMKGMSKSMKGTTKMAGRRPAPTRRPFPYTPYPVQRVTPNPTPKATPNPVSTSNPVSTPMPTPMPTPLPIDTPVTPAPTPGPTPDGGPPNLPPSPGFASCPICGNDFLRITLPDQLVLLPGQAPITCASFELAGEFGFVSPGLCQQAPLLTVSCACEVVVPGVTPLPTPLPTPAPTVVTPMPVVLVTPQPTPMPTINVATPFPTLAPTELQPIPPSPGFPACNICGAANLRVTINNAVVTVPTSDPVTCANLQRAGDLGFIEAQFCPVLPGFAATTCGCAEIAGGGIVATPVPTPAPTMVQPVPPSPGFPACNVCGAANLRVTLLEANVTIGGQDPVTCMQLQDAGDRGFIAAEFCPAVPAFAVAFCGCAEMDGLVPPTGSTPMPAPVLTPIPTEAFGGGGGIFPVCAICGSPALRITVPSNIVDVPLLGGISCMNLQLSGDMGFITVDECAGIEVFVNNAGCGCAPI